MCNHLDGRKERKQMIELEYFYRKLKASKFKKMIDTQEGG